MDEDAELRATCFLALAALQAQLGDDLPYEGALERGFEFRRRRVPFLNRQKGIYRARAQRGPAALSINTSVKSPYADETTPEGFLYAYRDGPVDQPDNRALRAAFELQVPLVYFYGVRAGWYQPIYPAYVMEDRLAERRVLVSRGFVDDLGPTRTYAPPTDELERRYVTREVRTRLHQARFRWLVLPAYSEQCAICRLKEVRLLDAAHIVEDRDPSGSASIQNGLSLCSIHHRAFDQHLVGIDTRFEVHVSRSLREEADGPMLDLLKGFHGQRILVPTSSKLRPDRERLERRFERFRDRS